MLSNTLRLEFCCLSIIHVLHPHYCLKVIGHTLKKQAKEQVCLYLWDYTINHNENEEEKEK